MEPDLNMYALYKAQHQDMMQMAETARQLTSGRTARADEASASSGHQSALGTRAMGRISAIAAMLLTLAVGW